MKAVYFLFHSFSQVLSRVALLSDDEFQRVLRGVVRLFAEERKLLEIRGSLIIRNLCTLLNAKSIYKSFSAILSGTDVSEHSSESDELSLNNLEFRSTMVQSLNLILLTARELDELRHLLQLSLADDAPSQASELFVSIYSCWCHNPVATISLCLMSQAYALASSLIIEFAEVDVTVGFLMQVDKLVQLLESPIFIRLRLQLLEVSSPCHHSLVKTLYGLLMLLPQSAAFRTLSSRLATVATLQRQTTFCQSAPRQDDVTENPQLLNCFQQVQFVHKRAYQRRMLAQSLLAS